MSVAWLFALFPGYWTPNIALHYKFVFRQGNVTAAKREEHSIYRIHIHMLYIYVSFSWSRNFRNEFSSICFLQQLSWYVLTQNWVSVARFLCYHMTMQNKCRNCFIATVLKHGSFHWSSNFLLCFYFHLLYMNPVHLCIGFFYLWALVGTEFSNAEEWSREESGIPQGTSLAAVPNILFTLLLYLRYT